MLECDVEVRQLRTREGTYINVLRSLQEGGIGLWSHARKRPTYLLIRGDHWLIITFDDDAWRDQELPRLIEQWAAERVYRLPSMELVQEEK